jgi:hypothetical protein
VRYVFDIKEDCNGKERYKPDEIVAKLRQVDVLVSQGQNMVEAIRQIGVSEVVSMPALSMRATRKSAFSSYLKSPRERGPTEIRETEAENGQSHAATETW